MKNNIVKKISKRFLNVAIIYLAILLLVFIFQRDILYSKSKTYYPPSEIGLQGFEVVTFKTEDGLDNLSWYSAPKDKEKIIVYFHGNSGSLYGSSYIFKKIAARGYGVLALEYRGYSKNEGSPTEDNLYEDARAGIKFLINEKKILPKDIILMGRSLGSGIAVKMATEFDLDSLILVSPYDSIAAIAQLQFWYLPAKFLMKDKYESDKLIKDVEEAIIIFHGDDDKTIPIENSRRLFDKINSEKTFYELKGYGHNGLDFEYILDKIEVRLQRLIPNESARWMALQNVKKQLDEYEPVSMNKYEKIKTQQIS